MRKSILAACCLSLLVAGCSDSSRQPTADESEDTTLFQVGEMCRFYQLAKKKSPEKFADLNSVNNLAGGGYEAVRSGRVILLYGASLPDTKEEPGDGSSDEVLAYQKDVPQSGGKVLMLDRTVKNMTAEEFKSAKKAGKEGPAPTPAKKG